MSRRRLSDLQRRRISRRREELSAEQAETLTDLQEGYVAARFGRHAEVGLKESNAVIHCDIRPGLAAEVVCGDEVLWRPLPEERGVIEQCQPRKTVLQRPGPRGMPRTIAANLDHLFIVTAARPAPDRRLLDQYLVCAEHAGLKPVVVLNKCDLPEFSAAQESLSAYEAIGYPVLACSAEQGQGIAELQEIAARGTCALVGQSGVGKSSLVNRLCPEADPAIGALSQAQALGRHTTTTARLYELDGGGSLIDAPGIREFPLLPMQREELQRCFPEFARWSDQCRFHNCRHEQEPDCAVRQALDSSAILPWRFQHFLEFADAMATEQDALRK